MRHRASAVRGSRRALESVPLWGLQRCQGTDPVSVSDPRCSAVPPALYVQWLLSYSRMFNLYLFIGMQDS